ncbi:Hypothetical predicted protein [Podarcis lilfordi]|uniref:Uncharacterized protein n=1 Tax=Podarcis lilfordi TaxID=74358 RepID=A0AA35PET5_9SAUR|nr:Hypothetical predicted protein [Podarcis lilfordi]
MLAESEERGQGENGLQVAKETSRQDLALASSDDRSRTSTNAWSCSLNPIKNKWRPSKLLSFLKQVQSNCTFSSLSGQELPKENWTLFMYATTAARILIAQNWKTGEIPSKQQWQGKLMNYAELAKLVDKLCEKDNSDFGKEWEPFTTYLQKQKNKQTWSRWQDLNKHIQFYLQRTRNIKEQPSEGGEVER